jgi:hypothetical protein
VPVEDSGRQPQATRSSSRMMAMFVARVISSLVDKKGL